MNRYKMFFIMVANSLLRRRARMAIALMWILHIVFFVFRVPTLKKDA